MRDFRKYEIWQDGVSLSTDIYRLTESFPKQETYALANQLQRAVVSIPSNIAEGSSRESEADFARFLEIALGSAYEVETQISIAYNLSYIDQVRFDKILVEVQSLEKRLTNFINKLRKR